MECKKTRWLWIPIVAYVALLAVRGGVSSSAVEVSDEEWSDSSFSFDPTIAPPTASGSPPAPRGYRLREVRDAKVTAYEPSHVSCGKSADGKTSIGRNAYVPDGVAVDPRAIPYGSVVFIPGAGYRRVDDTGGAMMTEWRRHQRVQIDLRLRTVKEARAWGVKTLPVHIFVKE